MKDRIFKHKITTAFGVLCMVAAITMFVLARVGYKVNITYTEMAGLAAFGYVFLMAKDSLITGLFLGAFNVGKK